MGEWVDEFSTGLNNKKNWLEIYHFNFSFFHANFPDIFIDFFFKTRMEGFQFSHFVNKLMIENIYFIYVSNEKCISDLLS